MSNNPESLGDTFSTAPEEPDLSSFPPPQGSYQPAPAAMPPVIVQAPSKKTGFRSGFGAGFGFSLGIGLVSVALSTIMGIFMVISVAGLLASSPAAGASASLTTIWGKPHAEKKIRVVQISGPILADPSDGGVRGSGTYGYEVADMIHRLDKDDSGALVLLVNTPGGSVVGSAAIADAVEDYKKRTGHKVYVHISSMSASGGVYSTSTASEIWADEGSLVGSIGVVSGPFLYYNKLKAIGSTLLSAGVEAESIESEIISAGKGKAFGNPFQKMDPQVKKHWQDTIEHWYGVFVNRMVQGRGMDAKVIRDEMGAMVFDTDQAKKYKLIDGVKHREEFFRYVAKATGYDPDKTAFEAVTEPSSFFSSMLGLHRAYGTSLPVEQGQGANPLLSQSVCAPGAVVAYYGSLKALCG